MDKDDRTPRPGEPDDGNMQPEEKAAPVSMDHLFQLMLQEEGGDPITEGDVRSLSPEGLERLARERAALIERLRKKAGTPSDPAPKPKKDAGS